MTKLHPADSICFAEIDGLIVVLDLSTEDYFILNTTGTHLWNALVNHAGDADAAARAVALHYRAADQHDILAQSKRTIEDWRTKGFLGERQKAAAPQPRQGRRLPGSPYCLELSACWSLAKTAFDFRWKGFARAYLDCTKLPLPSSREDSGSLMKAAESAFVRAENLFHFASAPRDCLPRSLALFRFCRSAGLPVGHRIGGQRFPQFLMHAWVEFANQVVLDDPECRREFTVLATIPP